MDFDRSTTALVFLGVVVLGTVGITFTPMQTSTVFTMVLPSMVLFGLLVLWIGVQHGEHRAR